MPSTVHPVQLHMAPPARTRRVHVLTRLLLLLPLAALGCSWVYWTLYLALPAVVVLLMESSGPDRYVSDVAPRVVRVLRWLASAYGYLWLLTDMLPTSGAGPVDLQITPAGRPTVASALLRVVTSVPATLLLIVLSLVGGVMWVIGAASILITERLPIFVADFLALTLRVQFRLLAYHLSLVDRYPSLEDSAIEPAAA